jgi:hypothetical protein
MSLLVRLCPRSNGFAGCATGIALSVPARSFGTVPFIYVEMHIYHFIKAFL